MSPTRLERLVVNLVSNAASWGATKIEVLAKGDRGSVTIEVGDNGTGIDKHDQPRIFEMFFSRRGGGSGLGLYLARKFAVDAGGDIFIDSELYKGARFTVRLPRSRATRAGRR